MHRFLKSKINRRLIKHSGHLLVAVFLLISGLFLGKTGGTNAFFMDTATSSGNTMTAGYWIPTLHMTVSPETPDGADGFYKTAPCVTLVADINGDNSGITIYYKFSNDGNPISGGTKYSTSVCVSIPDGDPSNFEAQAVNDKNSVWVSNIVSESFKVYTSAKSGEVVINEVMWMGSTKSSSDEWIELRNTTDHTIDISNWTIENAKHSGDNKITIKDGKTIGPKGYFLIAKYDKDSSNSELNVSVDDVDNTISLRDLGNGNLILRDVANVKIDEAKGGLWPAGWHGIAFHMSMERNKTPGDGTSGGSWHTCVDTHCNDTTFWDNAGTNFGTPGKENLSVNDPSDPNYDPSVMEQSYFDEQAAVTDETTTDPTVPADDTSVSNPAGSTLTTENPENTSPLSNEEPTTVTPPTPPTVEPTAEPVVNEPADGTTTPTVIDKPVADEQSSPSSEEKPKADVVVPEVKKEDPAPEVANPEVNKEEKAKTEEPTEEVKVEIVTSE